MGDPCSKVIVASNPKQMARVHLWGELVESVEDAQEKLDAWCAEHGYAKGYFLSNSNAKHLFIEVE